MFEMKFRDNSKSTESEFLKNKLRLVCTDTYILFAKYYYDRPKNEKTTDKRYDWALL